MASAASSVIHKMNHEYCDDGEYIVNGIQRMNFRILTADEIQRHSVVKVTNGMNLYDGNNANPTRNGLLDKRLGVGAKHLKCDTCFRDWNTCVGHFGNIELVYPVYHLGYFSYLVEILQSICKNCARVVLPQEHRDRYLPKLTEEVNPLVKKILHKEIIALCKKVKTCPYCKFSNGLIKKFAFMKIFHIKNATDTILINKIFENNKGCVDEVMDYFGSACEFLSPYNVLKLFERIPKSDYVYLLLFDNTPMDLIITHVPVPPCIIRPSASTGNTGTKSNEDDMTLRLFKIWKINDQLKKRVYDGTIFAQVVQLWDTLQIEAALYINSDVRNIPPSYDNEQLGALGIAQRLKGKEGRFRANLSGKRVNYSARTVISPDPNLGIDEVGIPLKIALHMTYPVKVTPFNINLMRQLVLNGPRQHPGAVMIFTKNRKIFLKYAQDRTHHANSLRFGDMVMRHMLNGDYVLFNRQPSLHRLSIMCHKVRIHPDQTFKFNECVCNPYNADFDGDEMNVHFMQEEEAKAEAATLMQSKLNMVSPRNGEPVIAPIQDFITSIYLMTKRDSFFNKFEVCQIITTLLDWKDCHRKIQLPRPAIIKPFPIWTGKQLFGMILKPFFDSKIKLNLKFKTKAYTSGDELCLSEGYVHIRNSELLCGTLDKSLIGGGSKKNIFYLILKEHNPDEAIQTMLRLCRVSSFFITNRGFSIGIDDVIPTAPLVKHKKQLVSKGYSSVQTYIDHFWRGILNPITGLTREQTLESLILKELSEIRDHAGKACIKQLSHKNSPLVMANCGSKGSYINVSQMAVCVGQQSIRGQRVTEGFTDRVLPHFGFGDKSPLAKGFVENSFYSGLGPFEFFFHAMAGREGLLDTAVKTAETGYMQRRLIKGLEDLVVHYDYSVRNSNGEIVQFDYGDDCIDPINIESGDMFIDFEYYWEHIMATNPAGKELALSSFAFRSLVQTAVKEQLKHLSDFYKNKLTKFLENVEDRIYSIEQSGQPLDKVTRITENHVRKFLEKIEYKFVISKIDPGTAIGAICAQSIGEPTTQMTLKTFHFAGVASMNITQGVPRITEIINATKNPSTPFIQADLVIPTDAQLAQDVKLKIENVYLDQICEKIYQTFIDGELCYILKLNISVYKQLQLNETILYEEIMSQLKPDICKVNYPYVKIFPNIRRMIYLPKIFEDEISKVCIGGNRRVHRVTIREDKGNYYLMIEGNGFLEVLGTPGINGRTTKSNNIHEVASVLGIEAARATIIFEIKSTMQNHGITIDERHLMLLADTMTASGHVVGMTRSGFSKVKSSTIKMASFERTIDNLYQASYYNNRDDLLGASECIIVGAPTKMGTGFFDIIPDLTSRNIDFKRYTRSTDLFNGIEL